LARISKAVPAHVAWLDDTKGYDFYRDVRMTEKERAEYYLCIIGIMLLSAIVTAGVILSVMDARRPTPSPHECDKFFPQSEPSANRRCRHLRDNGASMDTVFIVMEEFY
jgi:hypothetical protein